MNENKKFEMKVKKLIVGPLEANCYILWDEESKEAVVIDPGGEGERILKAIRRNSLKVIYIVDTHAHIDHIEANDFIREKTNAPLLIHSADVSLLEDLELNLSTMMGNSKAFLPPTSVLKNKDKIKVGKFYLQILHTPGHTPGSICLYVDNKLFTGDTLFAGGIGRIDLPGGDMEQLQESIQKKILELPPEVVVYPGHGPDTTIGQERQSNPFLQSSS